MLVRKTVLEIFKIALRLRDRHIFFCKNHWTFERFVYLNFEKKFWKTKSYFKKLADRFVGQSTTIANAVFPYKTVQSKASVNSIRPGRLCIPWQPVSILHKLHKLKTIQLCAHVRKDISTNVSQKKLKVIVLSNSRNEYKLMRAYNFFVISWHFDAMHG